MSIYLSQKILRSVNNVYNDPLTIIVCKVQQSKITIIMSSTIVQERGDFFQIVKIIYLLENGSQKCKLEENVFTEMLILFRNIVRFEVREV